MIFSYNAAVLTIDLGSHILLLRIILTPEEMKLDLPTLPTQQTLWEALASMFC